MKKTIKVLTSVIICFIVIALSARVNANTANYDITITAPSTTIDMNTQKEVTMYLKLTEFVSADTMLGYEAVLEYDENVFSSVTVTGMNDWIGTSSSNDIYNPQTKKLVSTTGNAKQGANVAKLVFTIKEGIEPQITQISIKDLLISTGSEDETSSEGATKTISFHLQKQQEQPIPDEQPDEDNNEENTDDNDTENNEQESPSDEENGQNNNENGNNGQNNNNGNNQNQINNENANNNNHIGNNNTSKEENNGNEQQSTNQIVNTTANTVTNRANITVTPTDNTKAQGSIPQTGGNTQILGAIVIIAILGIIMYIRYRSIEIK